MEQQKRYGHFDDQHREYVITDPQTPWPWINYLGNEDFFSLISNTAGPTYAYDLARTIFDIIENRKYEGNTGIYHYSNEGVCSWYDFTKLIAEIAGNNSCDIQPCHSDEFPSPVKRPAYSVLDKTKVKDTFGISVPYWTDSLKKCMSNLMK